MIVVTTEMRLRKCCWIQLVRNIWCRHHKLLLQGRLCCFFLIQFFSLDDEWRWIRIFFFSFFPFPKFIFNKICPVKEWHYHCSSERVGGMDEDVLLPSLINFINWIGPFLSRLIWGGKSSLEYWEEGFLIFGKKVCFTFCFCILSQIIPMV